MSKQGARVNGDQVLCNFCNGWHHKSLFLIQKGRENKPTPYRGRCFQCRKEYRKTRPNWTPTEEQSKRYRKNRKLRKKATYRNIYYRVCSCGKTEVMQVAKFGELCWDCQYSQSKARVREKYEPVVKVCPVCNDKHQTFKSTCSDACAKQLEKDARYRIRSRRRAKIKASRIENIRRSVIYRRDNMRCVSCSIRVQRDIINQPDSAHIDHIYPLAHGGTHTYNNLQLLCFDCNIFKSNSLPAFVLWPTKGSRSVDHKKQTPLVLYLGKNKELTSNIKEVRGG